MKCRRSAASTTGLWLAQAFGGHGVAPTTFAGEVLASAIAEGDTRWREFSDYGLVSALKPAGFVGAQLSYWWLQAKDAWKDRRERAMAGQHARRDFSPDAFHQRSIGTQVPPT